MDAVYIRTSTTDQDGAAQIEALRRALEARNLHIETVDVRVHTDIGHSGAKARRPELDKLRAAVRAGHVRRVFVYALDRLGRSVIDLLHLLNEFEANGCAVVSLREGIDLSTATGRLQVQLLAAFAEFERNIIGERTRAGLAATKAKGTVLGRPPRVVQDSTCEKAIGLRKRHVPWAIVAQQLSCPKSTLRNAVAAYKKRLTQAPL